MKLTKVSYGETRFWSKVDMRGDDECWPWLASVQAKSGYGAYRVGGRAGSTVNAHRHAYTLVHGDPGPFHVCHSCDNPPCCNPAHLFRGTPLDNHRDAMSKGRHAYGEKMGSAKLKAPQVMAIRWRFAAGERGSDLAKEHGVTHATVCDIVERRTWRWLAEA